MTLGSHQQSVGRSQTHCTPRWILDRLGPFDLDPAAADPRPWSCARINYSEIDDGLAMPWLGRVFLNPPYDRYAVGAWIRKLADHGRGIALLHVRCETDWFRPCWEKAASGILFMSSRIHFHRADGTRHKANSGAPPVLVSFGPADLICLRTCGIPGALVTGWEILEPGLAAHAIPGAHAQPERHA